MIDTSLSTSTSRIFPIAHEIMRHRPYGGVTSPNASETIPMQRVGTADDCVGAYLFLASDQLSGYVTGQVIEVNGGQLMP